MTGETNLPWLQDKGLLSKTVWQRAPQLQVSAGTTFTQYPANLLDVFFQVGSAPAAL